MGGFLNCAADRILFALLRHEWWSDLRERDHVQGVGVDGRIILRWILKNCVGVGGLHILHTYVEDKSDVWLTVHRNSVWIRKTNCMPLFVFFISLLIVAQHVSGNHVPIIRS